MAHALSTPGLPTSRPSLATLPLEIVELILNHLLPDHLLRQDFLKLCLVCKAWCIPIQRLALAELSFSTHEHFHTVWASCLFISHLSAYPWVASYVRSLHMHCSFKGNRNANHGIEGIYKLVDALPELRELVVYLWLDGSRELQLPTLNRPWTSLRTLCISADVDVIRHTLKYTPHLVKLELGRITERKCSTPLSPPSDLFNLRCLRSAQFISYSNFECWNLLTDATLGRLESLDLGLDFVDTIKLQSYSLLCSKMSRVKTLCTHLRIDTPKEAGTALQPFIESLTNLTHLACTLPYILCPAEYRSLPSTLQTITCVCAVNMWNMSSSQMFLDNLLLQLSRSNLENLAGLRITTDSQASLAVRELCVLYGFVLVEEGKVYQPASAMAVVVV